MQSKETEYLDDQVGAMSLNGLDQQRELEQSRDHYQTEDDTIWDKTKLIVNYLPQFATERDLEALFSEVGPVEHVRIMHDYRTGYSFGYGFVKYTCPEHAAKAISLFNGFQMRNKRLKVSYSRPRGQDMKDANLYITNLPKDVTNEDMDHLFGGFGEIIQKTLLKDKITGMPRGVGFVRYSKTEEARRAIAAMNGKQLEKSMFPLCVRVAEDHGKQKAHYLDHINYLCSVGSVGKRRSNLHADSRQKWFLENY